MTFENPAGLWLLALGLPILAFHFYKGRIRTLAVPTLLFWDQVIVEEERRSALKKLRHWASLILSLLVLVVLTSAVAAPKVGSRARWAVILDGRPRMAAVEADGRARTEIAAARAREFVVSLPHGDQVSVHDLSGIRTPFTADLSGLARDLAPPPPARAGNVRDRVTAALAAGADVTAVLFSDRPPSGVDDLLQSGRLRLARVGTPRENAGWVRGLKTRARGERRVILSLRAAAFGAGRAERDEILYLNGRELRRRKLALEPGATADREWVLDPAAFPGEKLEEGGLVEVALEPPDALAADDTASFVLPSLVPLQVLVVHPGKPSDLLLHALETLRAGGVIAAERGAATLAQYEALPPLGDGWIVIFDRTAPRARTGRGAWMVVGAPGPGVTEGPAIVDWDRDAPPNRGVDYGGLLVRRSRLLQGIPLVQAAEGAVATWTWSGGSAGVELGFALEESDIAARPTFLLLLLNFIEWVSSGRGLRSFPAEMAAGEPLRPERPLWIEEGELVVAQGGKSERIPVRRGAPERTPPAGAGFLRASAAGRTEWIGANVFDVEESDLRERPAPPAGVPLPTPAPWLARVPYALLAAAAGLALLLVEAWLYHRGSI